MARCTRCNIKWYILSVTCDRSVVLSTNKTDRYDINEMHVLLKVALNCLFVCCLMVFNFNTIQQYFSYLVAISFIGGGPGQNHRPVASHWQTFSPHNVVSTCSTPCHERDFNNWRFFNGISSTTVYYLLFIDKKYQIISFIWWEQVKHILPMSLT